MSLYLDAVSILSAPASGGGSFKSRVYNSRNIKSAPAQVYALIAEAAKWDVVLKEVIEKAGILPLEPKLTPLLSLLLVHDHLLSKRGIVAPASHPLRLAIERHKARLRAEFTKARLRRGCASVEELKASLKKDDTAANGAVYPRWVRVNNVLSDIQTQRSSTFAKYSPADTLVEVGSYQRGTTTPNMRLDPHIPDLVAVPARTDLTSSTAYKKGEIILQDKASCFPAYLLLGGHEEQWHGDIIDGCAAPGNKTTHLASLLASAGHGKAGKRRGGQPKIFALDASQMRSKTLQRMVNVAGADKIITVLPGQDFLGLDPRDERFENVRALLLDPSCSGSGIIGREDVPKLALPESVSPTPATTSQSKKRKRKHTDAPAESTPAPTVPLESTDAEAENDEPGDTIDTNRLVKLSNLQLRIVEHALSFPSATRVTYSTCSIHVLENEAVVARVLASDVARRRGWRIFRRDEQVAGLRRWAHRGVSMQEQVAGQEDVGEEMAVAMGMHGGKKWTVTDEVSDACLRCWPGDDEGTGGFFVAGFVRDGSKDNPAEAPSAATSKPAKRAKIQAPNGQKAGNQHSHATKNEGKSEDEDDEEEWEGFSSD